MTTATITYSYKFVFPQFTPSLSTFYVSLLSQFKMNSTNRPAPNVWVLIAQLVENYSANTEAMGSNPIEVPKFFSGLSVIA